MRERDISLFILDHCPCRGRRARALVRDGGRERWKFGDPFPRTRLSIFLSCLSFGAYRPSIRIATASFWPKMIRCMGFSNDARFGKCYAENSNFSFPLSPFCALSLPPPPPFPSLFPFSLFLSLSLFLLPFSFPLLPFEVSLSPALLVLPLPLFAVSLLPFSFTRARHLASNTE